MDSILALILTILIILAGISMMLGGSDGVKKFSAALFAPFGCIFKVLVGLLALTLFALIAYQGLKHARFGGGESLPQEGTPPQSDTVLLGQYPTVDQREFSNYVSPEFATSPDGNSMIYQKACLAAVYLMLTRAHDDPGAVIGDGQYNTGVGAFAPPGFSFVRKDYYGADEVVDEVRSGHPVILGAEGPGGFTHFALAVGYSRERGVLFVNDPAFGRFMELDISEGAPRFPDMAPNTITSMRLVRRL